MYKYLTLSIVLLATAGTTTATAADFFRRFAAYGDPAPVVVDAPQQMGSPMQGDYEYGSKSGYPFYSGCCEKSSSCCDGLWDGFCGGGLGCGLFGHHGCGKGGGHHGGCGMGGGCGTGGCGFGYGHRFCCDFGCETDCGKGGCDHGGKGGGHHGLFGRFGGHHGMGFGGKGYDAGCSTCEGGKGYGDMPMQNYSAPMDKGSQPMEYQAIPRQESVEPQTLPTPPTERSAWGRRFGY